MPKEYEPITVKQTLTKVKEERMPFNWSVNPYRGCAHGCSFCYARGFQAFIDKGADDEFQNHIMLKMNAAEALEAQLSKLAVRFNHDIEAVSRHVGSVAIGTVTDPYQPAEGKAMLTRECLKVLAKYRIDTSITTRSPLILRDLDLLGIMPSVAVNISLNTLDGQLARKLEPGSPLPSKRLDTLERLSGHGVQTAVFMAPILPYLTDSADQMEAIFAAARERGASYVMTSLLRLSPDVKKWYYKTLREHFPEKLPAYRNLYTGRYAEDEYRQRIRSITEELRRKHKLSPAPAGAAAAAGTAWAKERAGGSSRELERIAGQLPLEQLSFVF
ncbi:hypothetical protein PAE9249_02294 [Paenibacillus sp. CECT 9249]|uniref:SPL family radical SAM protein n=1 Tax=Paenibacillus sp. CECT 9249 TaxID=2845385 RepID=UPI001E2D9208|nr:radical SAM protein [Paenibacillus sp. CECT 9249]CAH0119786.1 hypothetical protein PAE9249_02294 [Paenibacillus sp. CECT 9249]